MKNSVILFIGLSIFIASQFLLSCKPSIDIAKRHYRSGYYINIGTIDEAKKSNINSSFNEEDALTTSTISESNTAINGNSVILNEDFSSNLTASIEKEAYPTKNKSIFSITPLINNNSFVLINSNYKSKQINAHNISKDYKAGSPSHDTGKILEFIGIVIGIIGVLVFLASFPTNISGMAIGRLLLVLGLSCWTIGMFL